MLLLSTLWSRIILKLDLETVLECVYGEHKQIKAILYRLSWLRSQNSLAISRFKLDRRCAAPSTINLTDLNRLVFFLNRFIRGLKLNRLDNNGERTPYVVAISKHNNICCCAYSFESAEEALLRAIESNPRDAFGGAMIANFKITHDHVTRLKNHRGPRQMDLIAAPSFDSEAREELCNRKHGKCRVYTNSALASSIALRRPDKSPRILNLQNELLIQDPYPDLPLLNQYETPYSYPALSDSIIELVFAQALMASMNSNTVVIVKNGQLLGAGVGQTSRIGAAETAIRNALTFGHKLRGALLGSDSYFISDDVAELAGEHKMGAILTTSGSISGDKPTLASCKKHRIKLVWGKDDFARLFAWHC